MKKTLLTFSDMTIMKNILLLFWSQNCQLEHIKQIKM